MQEQETALHLACRYGHLGVVQWLVAEAGAKVDAVDEVLLCVYKRGAGD